MPEYKKYLSILTGCLVGKVQQEKKYVHVTYTCKKSFSYILSFFVGLSSCSEFLSSE